MMRQGCTKRQRHSHRQLLPGHRPLSLIVESWRVRLAGHTHQIISASFQFIDQLISLVIHIFNMSTVVQIPTGKLSSVGVFLSSVYTVKEFAWEFKEQKCAGKLTPFVSILDSEFRRHKTTYLNCQSLSLFLSYSLLFMIHARYATPLLIVKWTWWSQSTDSV